MAAQRPLDVLALTRREAVRFSTQVGPARLRVVLRKAQQDLERRLRDATGLRGPGEDSFTAGQLRAVLTHVRDVLKLVKSGIGQVSLDVGDATARATAKGSIRYLEAVEKQFAGLGRAPIAIDQARVLDRAASGARSSILHRILTDPDHPGQPGVLDRYGDAVVQNFEEALQTGVLTQKPWSEVRQDLVAQSPFLQAAPAHWATRIVRTELMGAANVANWNAMQEMDAQLGGGTCRILCATFDGRTASDSYAVHGQVRRMNEPFESWFGAYMTPPGRPNDREVVCPHRIEWPIPSELRQLPDSAVVARWVQEGRKGSPPPRPKMTTIPLDQFGRDLGKNRPVRGSSFRSK